MGAGCSCFQNDANRNTDELTHRSNNNTHDYSRGLQSQMINGSLDLNSDANKNKERESSMYYDKNRKTTDINLDISLRDSVKAPGMTQKSTMVKDDPYLIQLIDVIKKPEEVEVQNDNERKYSNLQYQAVEDDTFPKEEEKEEKNNLSLRDLQNPLVEINDYMKTSQQNSMVQSSEIKQSLDQQELKGYELQQQKQPQIDERQNDIEFDNVSDESNLQIQRMASNSISQYSQNTSVNRMDEVSDTGSLVIQKVEDQQQPSYLGGTQLNRMREDTVFQKIEEYDSGEDDEDNYLSQLDQPSNSEKNNKRPMTFAKQGLEPVEKISFTERKFTVENREALQFGNDNDDEIIHVQQNHDDEETAKVKTAIEQPSHEFNQIRSERLDTYNSDLTNNSIKGFEAQLKDESVVRKSHQIDEVQQQEEEQHDNREESQLQNEDGATGNDNKEQEKGDENNM